MNAKRHSSAKTRRLLRFESMESRRLLAADVFQHNFDMAEDVNGDKFVSPIDVLLLINKMNASTTAVNASPSSSASLTAADVDQFFMDVNGNGQLELESSPENARDLPLPADFPAVADGTTVQVGIDSGALAVPTNTNPGTGSSRGDHDNDSNNNDDHGGGHEGNEAGETSFVSRIQGTGTQVGTVKFETETTALQPPVNWRSLSKT